MLRQPEQTVNPRNNVWAIHLLDIIDVGLAGYMQISAIRLLLA